jgi:hypothetical protein
VSLGRTYVLRDDGVRERFKAFLDELPRDQLWEVTVAPFKARQRGQRAKWHAQIAEIARETGNDPGREGLPEEQVRAEARGGDPRRVAPGAEAEHAYTAEEYSEMIDRTSQWAAAELQLFV